MDYLKPTSIFLSKSEKAEDLNSENQLVGLDLGQESTSLLSMICGRRASRFHILGLMCLGVKLET